MAYTPVILFSGGRPTHIYFASDAHDPNAFHLSQHISLRLMQMSEQTVITVHFIPLFLSVKDRVTPASRFFTVWKKEKKNVPIHIYLHIFHLIYFILFHILTVFHYGARVPWAVAPASRKSQDLSLCTATGHCDWCTWFLILIHLGCGMFCDSCA